MLYVLLVLMYTLSLIFLSFHLFDLSTTCTCATPQSMLWFVFIQWIALAFRTSPVATALVFTDPGLQGSSCFTNVDLIALCKRDLVHHTLVHMLLWSLHPLSRPLSAESSVGTQVVLQPSCRCPLSYLKSPSHTVVCIRSSFWDWTLLSLSCVLVVPPVWFLASLHLR